MLFRPPSSQPALNKHTSPCPAGKLYARMAAGPVPNGQIGPRFRREGV